jgi:hypothetical protein
MRRIDWRYYWATRLVLWAGMAALIVGANADGGWFGYGFLIVGGVLLAVAINMAEHRP